MGHKLPIKSYELVSSISSINRRTSFIFLHNCNYIDLYVCVHTSVRTFGEFQVQGGLQNQNWCSSSRKILVSMAQKTLNFHEFLLPQLSIIENSVDGSFQSLPRMLVKKFTKKMMLKKWISKVDPRSPNWAAPHEWLKKTPDDSTVHW